MPMVARAKSSSGYYHVMARGSGGQLLFECGEDYAVFLESLGSCADEHSASLIAYCLMPNHVHLLVRDGDDELGEMMRSLLSGYAQSYNKRTGHVGHVFQQRFKSCPVESDEYLLQLVRYIHENPAKAGICKAEEYWWSSYHEYVAGPVRVDTNLVLSMVGGVSGFKRFSKAAVDRRVGGVFSRLSDSEAHETAVRELDGLLPSELKALSRARRNELILKLKNAGLTIRQIERLTGIGRNIIARA